MAQALKCAPFSSVVEPGFWSLFAKKKLEELKLDDAPLRLSGRYAPSRSPALAPQLRITGEDLLAAADQAAAGTSGLALPAQGELINTNTLEDFKLYDKKALLARAGAELEDAIRAGRVEEDPSLLIPFRILSHADLKQHRFLYWFCFPAAMDPRLRVAEQGAAEQLGLADATWAAVAAANSAFFAVLADGSVVSLAEAVRAGPSAVSCLGMADPAAPGAAAPGWPVFNLARWAAERLDPTGSIPILCARTGGAAQSVLLRLERTGESDGAEAAVSWTGWEPNAQGKMGPRLSNLADQLDPERLAQSATDLNLKLMRWRALPELDTDRLAETSCLLVGAGTLGCAVARTLLGWGFRRITLLDGGTVSYSNPVRQSLFEFEDCKDGGKPKAEAAAAALKRIFPGTQTRGVQLNIPMPGHFVTSEAAQKEAFEAADTLEALIAEHDAIALLTDTRESRWLPTMLAAKHDKLLINSALGFDSYMVMRHGGGPHGAKDGEERLGCYFCNDVVAPQNSMKDRTLDQQCTVTRPGLAPIAGALLVELLVGLLHHPDRQHAPVGAAEGSGGLGKLGELPHQVRGSLATFNANSVVGQAFPQCTACSACVVDAYEREGKDLLLRAFNNPTALEDLTGLTELMAQSAAIDELLLDGSGSDDDF